MIKNLRKINEITTQYKEHIIKTTQLSYEKNNVTYTYFYNIIKNENINRIDNEQYYTQEDALKNAKYNILMDIFLDTFNI